MEQRPSGIVAFLFTDVEGSTALWSVDADAMASSLRLHDDLLRAAIADRCGYVFATGGDGFAVAFSRVSDAIDTACAAQEALAGANWEGPELRVRMGIHVGEAEERDGDYFGPSVNIAARVMAAGHGGQVLMTGQAADAAHVEVVELGHHALGGVVAPQRIVQLGVGSFPPLRLASSSLVSLPSPRTSLVGRRALIDELLPLVVPGTLVTLTGVGGCGKTRLAIELAHRSLERFPDGVWFVDLSTISDPAALGSAVAEALSFTPSAMAPVVDQVGDYLSGRTALVVIDNCEHLLDDVADAIEALTATAPQVAVLATSREQLDVDGELAVRVPSLDVGPGSPAVELFIERATAAGAALAGAELDEVASICAELDGIPLAIELAAARTRSMSAAELRVGLQDRFRLLGGRRRGRQRQQTLESTVQWSVDLCDEAERRMLRHLSVFQGGFDPHDAAAVAGVADTEALGLIDSLVAKSLVDVQRADGTARRRLLETIRLFAMAQLIAEGEAEEARNRHLDRFVGDPMVANLGYDAMDTAHVRMAREYDNFRSAGSWAIDCGRPTDAARIASAIQEAMSFRGEIPLALEWLAHVPDDVEDAIWVLAAEAHLRYFHFDLTGMSVAIDRAIDLAQGQPYDAMPWVLGSSRSLLRMATGDVAGVWATIEEARVLAPQTASHEFNRGLVEFLDAAYSLGTMQPERCIERARAARALFPGHAVGHLVDDYAAFAHLSLGRPDEARAALEVSRRPSPVSPYGHLRPIAQVLTRVDRIGPEAAARELALVAPEPIARQPFTTGDWLIAFAWLACERGELDRAAELVRDTKHHSLAWCDVWRRALRWPGDGRDSFQKWSAENPWSELIPRALSAHPRLIREELTRWAD